MSELSRFNSKFGVDLREYSSGSVLWDCKLLESQIICGFALVEIWSEGMQLDKLHIALQVICENRTPSSRSSTRRQSSKDFAYFLAHQVACSSPIIQRSNGFQKNVEPITFGLVRPD